MKIVYFEWDIEGLVRGRGEPVQVQELAHGRSCRHQTSSTDWGVNVVCLIFRTGIMNSNVTSQ